jgi:hypothetical protein
MTHLITIDFETYYDQDYSLSKISTEEYVRAGLFQTIGFSYKVDDAPPVWVSGGELRVTTALDRLPWADSLVLAHNTMFDGAILSWRYGIKPMGWLDTQSMARALHGVEQSVSLKNIAVQYQQKAGTIQNPEIEDNLSELNLPKFGQGEDVAGNGTEIINYADEATSMAEIERNRFTPIFEIITNRYRKSAWNKLTPSEEGLSFPTN